ncbi:MAG: AAA family ATPase [Bacteroidales bacterium]|nr:AAA family ATPase [Bacteroidales bacterium]
MASINRNFSVEGIQLDPDNQEFRMALEYALYTNTSIYLTGKAGSGKTTFLKYLRGVTEKNIAVLAPTGVAAVNAGGQTIHSFFQIPPSIYVPNDKRLREQAPIDDVDQSTLFDNFQYKNEKRKLIRGLELLIIDEVSMVRADLLDVVDTLLRVFRKSNLPFGGVQVILIGDTFQLPPVVVGDERDLLYRFYESEFFFSAKVIKRCKPLYIELKKIYRQNERDFIDLLNRVRVNNMLPADYETLKGKLNPRFQPGEDDHYIILATTNHRVSDINNTKLDELKTPLKTYSAEIKGEFPLNIRPTDTDLHLKVGAQVMFVKNDREKRYYNGKIGKITATNDDEVKVEIETLHGDHQELVIFPEDWRNVVYKWDEEEQCIKEEVVGIFTQYPLRLAWAITVHKSQGLTFEKVIADIGSSFASGQVYVALSRCTSMNGLVLTSEILPRSVKTDKRVLEFAKNETPETLLTEQLSHSKADYFYFEARKAFHAREVDKMLDNFLSAIKYRNDISTEIFRRYVSVWTNKLLRYKEQSVEMQIKMSEQEHNLSETIANQVEEINDLSLRIESFKRNLKAMESSLRSAEETIKSKEADIASKDEEIRSKELAIFNLNKSLVSSIQELKETNQKIEQLEHKIKELDSVSHIQKEEIKRISSITWIQKLLGRH